MLGELLVGVLLGNLALVGLPSLDTLRADETFALLAELGAILLLFSVGLESTPRDMLAVGGSALTVAVVGVATPMLDGHPVVDPGTYAAAVFMVIATTLVTPPLLVWSIERQPAAESGARS